MKSTTDGAVVDHHDNHSVVVDHHDNHSVVVDHHDNHSVDGTPEGEPPATSLNPFDNEDDDDVVEEEE